MEENHGYEEILGASTAPYINSLARAGALFTESYAIEHPSQPNCLDLFSGSNQGVTSDICPQTFSTPNLGAELIGAGLTFAGFSEDLPEGDPTICRSGSYRRRHSPWVNFTSLPETVHLPLTSWPSDLQQLPTLSFVIPNLENDMRNGSIERGDTWLRDHLEAYRQWAMTHNSLLIVTWDEDHGTSGNHIPTIFVGPMVLPGSCSGRIDHFDLLRTLEDMFGLPALGKSAGATTITEVRIRDAESRFIRGDCNVDGEVDISGPIRSLLGNLAGGSISCPSACDANGDSVTGGVSDAVFVLNFLFRHGPAPVAPSPACGPPSLASDLTVGCETPPESCR